MVGGYGVALVVGLELGRIFLGELVVAAEFGLPFKVVGLGSMGSGAH
jgi:hypothetical protein